eukprot:scaffold15654_cov66-Phaeocystis_antarctica.AAC.4
MQATGRVLLHRDHPKGCLSGRGPAVRLGKGALLHRSRSGQQRGHHGGLQVGLQQVGVGTRA